MALERLPEDAGASFRMSRDFDSGERRSGLGFENNDQTSMLVVDVPVVVLVQGTTNGATLLGDGFFRLNEVPLKSGKNVTNLW